MRADWSRCVRVVGTLLLVASALMRAGFVSAQDDATPSAVDGNTYESPTFGYTLEWDDSVWSVTDDYSESGYDSLTLVTLEPDIAALYVESMYFYEGDPDECLAGEQARIAESDGVDSLDPILDDQGDPIATSDDGDASALFSEPYEAEDGSQVDGVVYLECKTLIPNSAVLIITGSFDADNAEDATSYINGVLDSLTLAVGADVSLSDSDIEQITRLAETDIDAFWTSVFTDLGQTYEEPKFITFSGPIETGCGEETSGESGPFYCPDDETVYLDSDSMRAEYLPFGIVVLEVVIAHELGHHVQALLGLDGCTDDVCGEPGGSLAIELQADCFAGAWTKDAADRGAIQQGDISRVDAATEKYFGDPPETPNDDPDAHGSGEVRDQMFHAGFDGGVAACGLE